MARLSIETAIARLMVRYSSLPYPYGALLARRGYAPSAQIAIPPIVVCGTGGSGTRAIVRILESGIWIGGIFNDSADSLPVAYFLQRWLKRYLSGADVNDSMQREFDRVLAAHRRGMNDLGGGWLVKNPRLLHVLSFLDKAVPGYRLIHVVRDGRDMAVSTNQQQLRDLGPLVLGDMPTDRFSPRSSLDMWARVNSAAFDYATVFLTDRYHVVRFEDLVAKPAATTQELQSFAGVALDPNASLKVSDPGTIGRWTGFVAESDISTTSFSALRLFGYV